MPEMPWYPYANPEVKKEAERGEWNEWANQILWSDKMKRSKEQTVMEDLLPLLWSHHHAQTKWEIIGALVADGKRFNDFPKFIRDWIMQEVGSK